MKKLFKILSFTLLSTSAQAVTVVIDFNDATQANTSRWNDAAEEVSTFDITGYGQANTAANRNTLMTSVLAAVRNDYYFDLGAALGDSSLNGQQLDVDFELGDFGTAPANGDTNYYFFQVGTSVEAGESSLGRAWTSSIKSRTGNTGYGQNTNVMGSVFTNNIDNIYAGGGMDEAVNLIVGTLSHEIGHAFSLSHLEYDQPWTTANGLAPLMSSGATGLPNSARRVDREFSLSGTYGNSQDVGHVQQLVNALGTRPVPEPSSTLLMGLGALGILFHRRK